MTGLVPEGLDDAAVARFIYLTVATLGLLSIDPVIQQYVASAPDAHRAIRELSGAVAAAGVRVRDSGRRQRDEFEEHVRLFTADEIWLVNLAVDVIAMLTGLGSLRPDIHAQAVSDLEPDVVDDSLSAIAPALTGGASLPRGRLGR